MVKSRLSTSLLLLSSQVCIATWDGFQIFFTSQHLTYLCGKNPCKPPSMCASRRDLGSMYCCHPGQEQSCYAGAAQCRADSLKCGSAMGEYCCEKDIETCNAKDHPDPLCYTTNEPKNPLRNLTDVEALARTYSSLSALYPSATSLVLGDLSHLTIVPGIIFPASTPKSTATTPTASNGSDTSITISTPTSTNPLSNPANPKSSSSLSGAAIGGIVGGILGGIIKILASILFLLWRRRQKNKVKQQGRRTSDPDTHRMSQEKYIVDEQEQERVREEPTLVSEVEGTSTAKPLVELDGRHHRPVVEMGT